MPELPEVETVKNTLIPLLKGKEIENVEIYYPRLIQSNPSSFKSELLNKTINNISRYGKFLFFELSDDKILIVHLRMEGKFAFHQKNEPYRISSTNLVFFFKDKTTLSFNDTRKFGIMYLTDRIEIKSLNIINKLGIEANKIDTKDYDELIKKLSKNKAIKTLITDQSILAGIGNIYADEILYKTKIHPLTKGKDIAREQFINLFQNSKIILNEAIKLGGSTIHSFSSNGIDGKFQEELSCYGKEGNECPRCKTHFHKIFLNGRGTTFCPNCQVYEPLKKAIGVTGSIGSGKSTVLSYLSSLGYLTISSDEEIRKIYQDPIISKKVSNVLRYTFNINKKEDRYKIKKTLSESKEIKLKVENILYPELEKILINYIINNEKIAIEVPLLFKAHYEYMFKKIIVVTTNEESQLNHLNIRGDNITTSLKINKDFNYRKNQDNIFIIENNEDKESLYRKIDNIIKN